jgi:hypothetical protein
VLGQLAVLDAEEVEGDERVGAEAVVGAVQGDQVTVRDHAGALVAEAFGQAGHQAAQRFRAVGGQRAVLRVVGGDPAVHRGGVLVAEQLAGGLEDDFPVAHDVSVPCC